MKIEKALENYTVKFRNPYYDRYEELKGVEYAEQDKKIYVKAAHFFTIYKNTKYKKISGSTTNLIEQIPSKFYLNQTKPKNGIPMFIHYKKCYEIAKNQVTLNPNELFLEEFYDYFNNLEKSLAKEKVISFNKPTINEIDQYIKEKGYAINPVQFYDYYEKLDWHHKKTNKPVKNWKLALSTWNQNNKKSFDEKFKDYSLENNKEIEAKEKRKKFMEEFAEYHEKQQANQLKEIEKIVSKKDKKIDQLQEQLAELKNLINSITQVKKEKNVIKRFFKN